MPSDATPLMKLDLPSPEEFRKRKVALLSGESPPFVREDMGSRDPRLLA